MLCTPQVLVYSFRTVLKLFNYTEKENSVLISMSQGGVLNHFLNQMISPAFRPFLWVILWIDTQRCGSASDMNPRTYSSLNIQDGIWASCLDIQLVRSKYDLSKLMKSNHKVSRVLMYNPRLTVNSSSNGRISYDIYERLLQHMLIS